MYGAFLRSLRRSQNLTQRQLSEIVGIAQANLSAYENDRQMPSFDMVNKLVNACGYRFTVDEASQDIHVPLARGGWTPCEKWPERTADDPTSEQRGLTVDTPPLVRAAVIERVLTGLVYERGPK